MDLTARVHAVIRRIPPGRVLGYRDVAALAGNALAARRVGAILRESTDATLPWWRVVASDGSVRTGARGMARLRGEGVAFTASGRVKMALHRWTPKQAARPRVPSRSRARPPK